MKEIRRGNFLITVCCNNMASTITAGRAIPVEVKYYDEEFGTFSEATTALNLMGDEGICVATAYYCWNCGKKIQMRKVEG